MIVALVVVLLVLVVALGVYIARCPHCGYIRAPEFSAYCNCPPGECVFSNNRIIE